MAISKYWRVSLVIPLAFMIFIIWSSLIKVEQTKVRLEIHLQNICAIFISLFVLQVARLWLERKETESTGRAPIRKSIFDLIKNFMLFVTCYVSTFRLNRFYIAVGMILALVSVARILKYRIYDDIYRYKIHLPGSQRYVIPGEAGHVLLRCLLDHLPRAYLYTAFSFTIFQLLLMSDPLYGMQKVTGDAFQVSNPSGNPLADFFYFNVVTIATVGYGDISPVSALAKVICSMEILFAFIILTAILTTLIGRFQKIADQDDKKRFVNK